ncbi:MAG: hypothetical protein MAG715_00541 [Methanonatronarchaeales archaeon]|nr:hypothetical protein [Methanonatronarchaeales archaeon]
MNTHLEEAVCSGVRGSAEETQELLVETAELARGTGYEGYIHLKVMPGAPRHLVERGAESADRLSVNVETLPSRMEELSSTKHYRNDIERRLRWASGASPSSGVTTQLIAAGESDREVFDEVRRLYGRFGLRRVYFSAFRAIPGTEMESRKATDPRRDRRLYRVDWLTRVYGFDSEEVEGAFRGGSLPDDPKTYLAGRNGLRVDPSDASREELLRVPGIGPGTAGRILEGEDVRFPRRSRPFLEGQSRLDDFS